MTMPVVEERGGSRVRLQLPREMAGRPPEGMDRRRFMGWSGWVGILGSLAVGFLGFVRFLFPRVLFEPPAAFTAGRPEDYIAGTVDERFKQSQRVWIVREEGGLYALLAVCTHLGCTPNWLPQENKFKCPCHGSGFHRSGINFEGPAPRPLERLMIALADDGQLLVDKSKSYRQEKGQWDDPGAYLRI